MLQRYELFPKTPNFSPVFFAIFRKISSKLSAKPVSALEGQQNRRYAISAIPKSRLQTLRPLFLRERAATSLSNI
jgi:hypothetical protein